MPFSSSGIQTGIDTDLSGLSLVASHQSNITGSGDAAITNHTITDALDITGDLTISPETENLTCSHVIIRNGATLTIEGTILRFGDFVRYSQKNAITTSRTSGHFANDAGLLIENGGTIIHRGGLIRCNAPIVTNNCNYILAGAIVEQFNGGGTAQWRHQGTTFSLDTNIDAGSSGLILRGTDLTVIGGNIPPRYRPQGMQAAFGWSSATPNTDFPVPSPNLTDLTTTRHTSFWRGNRPIFRNGLYTVINAGGHISGNASSYGTAIVEVDVNIQPRDLQSNNVEARIFRRASVLGKQVDYTQEGHFVDGTSDIVTNRLVSEGAFSYRTRVNNSNVGNGDPENTGNYAWGYYGDSDTDEGSLLHTFQIRSYGLVASSITIQEGQGSVSQVPVLLPNNSVVSTLAVAQAALASLTIDLDNLVIDVDAQLSAQRIHDALDLWMTQADQQEIDYFFSISGNTLVLNDGWSVNPLTLENVDGGIVDLNGDSFFSFDSIDSWRIYADEENTNLLANGTGTQNFRFTFASGVTYYFNLVVSGETISKVITPQASGETAVSLNTASLLTALSSDLRLTRDHSRAANQQTKLRT